MPDTTWEQLQYIWKSNEAGMSIPGALIAERFRPLHSLRNPERERLHVENSATNSDFLIVLGAAGFYHIPDPVEDRLIVVIEPDSALIESARMNININLFTNRKDLILVARNSGESIISFTARVSTVLKTTFTPLLHLKFSIFSHRGSAGLRPVFFNQLEKFVSAVLDGIISDFSTQKHMGRLWFSNILRNNKMAESISEKSQTKVRQNQKLNLLSAVICGAGPSLEKNIDEIKNTAPGNILIAADTALPILIKHSLIPDYVVTLDAQLYSIYHYISVNSFTEKSTFILDSGVHPSVFRKNSQRVEISLSPHPLSNILMWPDISTSRPVFHSSNAGLSCIGTALGFGITRLSIFGLDYKNTGGIAYSRGSYQHDWINCKSSRFLPAEYYHYRLATNEGSADLNKDKEEFFYINRNFTMYEQEFIDKVSQLGELTKLSTGVFSFRSNNPVDLPATSHMVSFTGLSLEELAIRIEKLEVNSCLREMKTAGFGEAHPELTALKPLMAAMLPVGAKIDAVHLSAVFEYARKKISHIMKL